MSNRRRAERRDAHGAPIRSRAEIWTAVGTAVAVVAVTALLLWMTRNRPPSIATPAVVTSSTTAPSTSSTTTTLPASTSPSSAASTSTAPSTTTSSSP